MRLALEWGVEETMAEIRVEAFRPMRAAEKRQLSQSQDGQQQQRQARRGRRAPRLTSHLKEQVQPRALAQVEKQLELRLDLRLERIPQLQAEQWGVLRLEWKPSTMRQSL